MELDIRLFKFERRRSKDEPGVERFAGWLGRVSVRIVDTGCKEIVGRETTVLVHGQMSFQLFGIAQHFGWNNWGRTAHALCNNSSKQFISSINLQSMPKPLFLSDELPRLVNDSDRMTLNHRFLPVNSSYCVAIDFIFFLGMIYLLPVKRLNREGERIFNFPLFINRGE